MLYKYEEKITKTGCKKQPVFAVFPVEFCGVFLRFEQFQNCRVAG
jgi:hypothetical protein